LERLTAFQIIVLMSNLLLHGRNVDTVFGLMGRHENDMTRALGWTLSVCPQFLRALNNRVVPISFRSSQVAVRLQVWQKPKGYTDIELSSTGLFHLIIEAKRGWQQPGLSQLRKYAARLRKIKHGFKCLVMLTDWSYSGAATLLKAVDGIPVVWLSWADVAGLAFQARWKSSQKDRHWIDELTEYLGGAASMQDSESNWVYVVSLGKGVPKGWKISWIDIVESERRYFHPAQGGGWPKTPPNYLAWRHGGKLQGIAHIVDYEIAPDVHSSIPEIPRGRVLNHVVYRLGKPFRPDHDVKTGRIFRSGRRWCMLDTLFTCRTLSDAANESKRRERDTRPFAP
jgi:hypothetical protein